jgi:type I restriction-modification system DNA methylase subunit
MDSALRSYIESVRGIYVSNNATEMSYRTALQNLLTAFSQSQSTIIDILHEPERESGFGAPDLKISKQGAVIGYIETKQPNEDLHTIKRSPQIKKYLSVTPNLLLTDFFEFILFKDGKVYDHFTLFDINNRVNPNSEQSERFLKLLDAFFLSAPVKIAKLDTLAEELAKRGKLLKESITDAVKGNQEDEHTRWLKRLHRDFKNILIADLSEHDFSDAYTQTIIYGLILAAMSKPEKLTRQSVKDRIPVSYSVIGELFANFSQRTPPLDIGWLYDDIIAVINSTDFSAISSDLVYLTGQHENDDYDPYYHFYEPFLEKFDAVQRKDKGVYYTPLPVVDFIVRSLDKILIGKLDIPDGFLDKDVTTLDFACGTGTFLAEIFKHINQRLIETHNESSRNSIINEHLLKNFYGFEYLIAPFSIAHLKLSRLLSEMGDNVNENRLQIYLTDTLNQENVHGDPLLITFAEESNKANAIKRDGKILVITGNPPYNNHSKNKGKWILEQIKSYVPADERNTQQLTDDYIKFIRFAHYKIAQNKKGVVGIITNNSFINGITHREMRSKLLSDFDEIYILNLHGNSNIEEISPDGTPDQNVFDIKQGVCITFFIRNGKKAKSDLPQVHYQELWGKRTDKFKFLRDNDIDSVVWKNVKYDEFDTEFAKTRWVKDSHILSSSHRCRTQVLKEQKNTAIFGECLISLNL